MLQLATGVATCNIKGGWYRGTVAEEGVVEAYQVKREVSRDPTCLLTGTGPFRIMLKWI